MPTEKRLLLSRDFALIWWSQVLSQVADGVSRLALLWFVYSVTGSAIKTSVIGLLQTISPILLGPLIGVTVDRLPKKAILIITDVTRGILIGLIPCVLTIEVFTVDMLYLLVFLYGIATAMFVPTLSSSVPFLVDRPRYVAANAMLQSTTSIGIIIGPALSGLGIAFAGSQEVLCANALIYFASALCLVPIKLPWSKPSHPQVGAVSATLQDLMEGIRYSLFSQQTILVLILLASLYTFAAGAYTTLFPVFGKKMLALGPVEVGYLWSWLGIGLFLVSLALVPLSQASPSHRDLLRERRRRALRTCLDTEPGGRDGACHGRRDGIWDVDADCLGHDPGIRAGRHGGTRHGDLHRGRHGDVTGRHFFFRMADGAGQ
jgi:DHA3 family macrolide efflux protein-like MFS transporter